MKKLKFLCVFSIFVVLAAVAFAGGQKEKTTAEAEKMYDWKLASGEIEGDFMTVWAKKFADELEQWSKGSAKTTVYPFGTLGTERDIVELAQTNTVQFCFTDFGWISGFVPPAQIFALHYLWPREKFFEVFADVIRNGEAVKLLEDKFRERNLESVGYLIEGWQWWTSNKPIRSLQDMKGFKIRVMSSKMLVEDYNAYGCSTTPMDFGEVYSGLQMGLIEGQSNPLAIGYSMKFYEVQDYFTQSNAVLFVAIPTMNRDLYDSLPKEMQDKIKEIWDSLLEPSWEWAQNKNAEFKKKILEERPQIEFYSFNDEQIEEFLKVAKTVYPKYVQIGGDGAEEILDAMLKDIERAKDKLGVK